MNNYLNYDKRYGLFELATIIMTLKVMFDKIVYYNNHLWLDNVLTISGVAFYMLVIVVERKHSIRECMIIGGLGLLCLYSSLAMGEYYLLMSYFLVVASVGKDINKCIGLMSKTKMLIVAFSVMWYLVAYFIIDDTIYTVYKQGRIAHHFGFSSPNSFALIVCWIICEQIYLQYHKIQFRHLISLNLLSCYIYWLTSCDTSLYISFILSILIIIDKKVDKMRLYLMNIAKYIFPVFSVFMAICIYVYQYRTGVLYNFVYWLNLLLTSRIQQAAQIFDLYGWSIVGQSINLGGTVSFDYYYKITVLGCDGLYTYMLVCGGVVFLAIISCLFFYVIKRSDSRYWIFIITFSLYSVLEIHGSNAFMVFVLLISGSKFFNILTGNINQT